MTAPTIKLAAAAALLAAFSAPAVAGPQHNCDNYASFAVSDAFAAKNKGCGFKGRRWGTNFKQHRNWCRKQGVTMAMLTSEDRARKNALAKCKSGGGKPTNAQCNTYAQAAINQQNSNLLNKCGYKGRRWQLAFNKHKNWCLGASKKAMAKEQMIRYQRLVQCKQNKP